MSHLTNNDEGSFDFPSRQVPPTEAAIYPTSSPADKEDSHSEVISQAKQMRSKAEELIASLSGDDQEKCSFISLADEDEQMRPGDFAAADPYVDTSDLGGTSKTDSKDETKQTANADTNQKMDNNKTATELAEIVNITKDVFRTQFKSGSDGPSDAAGLSAPTENSAGQAAEQSVRTVEEILAGIPGYEAETGTTADSEPASNPSAQTAQKANAATAAALSTVAAAATAEVANKVAAATNIAAANTAATASSGGTEPRQTTESPAVEAAAAETACESAAGDCGSLLNCEGEALVPVSWFSQAETEEASADHGTGTVEALADDFSFVSTTVDPATGEEQFDVRDFLEMADTKPDSIPNAFKDSSETAAQSPSGPSATPGSTGAAAGLDSAGAPDDTTGSPIASTVAALTGAAAAGGGLLAAITGKSKSASAESASSAENTDAGTAAGALTAALGSATESVTSAVEGAVDETTNAETTNAVNETTGNPLAKVAPPAPTIDDDEIAAAFASCDLDSEPTAPTAPTSEPPTSAASTAAPKNAAGFSQESFGEPESQAPKNPADAAAGFSKESFGQSESQGPTESQGTESQAQSEPQGQSESQTASNQTETEPDESTFLVDEGDVIRIDGNDGFDFIDLTCFSRSAATIKHDRIIVKDDENPSFEVHFKNIPHALFADGVTVDLTPTVDLAPTSG